MSLSKRPPIGAWVGRRQLGTSGGQSRCGPRAKGPNRLWPEEAVPIPRDQAFVGDINGDGKADVIIFARSAGKVSVSLTP